MVYGEIPFEAPIPWSIVLVILHVSALNVEIPAFSGKRSILVRLIEHHHSMYFLGNVYLENPSLKSFSNVEYDSLLKALREDASEVGVDSDDPFDLDGLDTDRIDLSDEKKAFLAQFVEILMNLKTTTWYDPRKFAGSLVLEKCLLALSRFKEASAMRHSSSEEETPEEQETRRHLEHEVKKAKQLI